MVNIPVPESMVVLLLLLAAAVVVRLWIKCNGHGARPLYQSRYALLTKAEASFLRVLEHAVQYEFRVFAKVRLADIITTDKTIPWEQSRASFNRIASKHVDFVLCDPVHFRVMLIIELDDASHRKESRRKRDEFVNFATASAQIPLLRIEAARGYSVGALRKEVFACLSKNDASETQPAGEAP